MTGTVWKKEPSFPLVTLSEKFYVVFVRADLEHTALFSSMMSLAGLPSRGLENEA